MSSPILTRERVCQVFATFRALHPTRSKVELCEMTAKATSMDAEAVAQVVEADMAETEGGTPD